MLETLAKLPEHWQQLEHLERQRWLSDINEKLERLTPQARIEWALESLPEGHVLSSSFGIQAAVLLNMVTKIRPDIPVVLIDTGYLFAETYQFIDHLTDQLNLNLKIYTNPLSSAWQEVRYGKLWEQGVDGLTRYNQMNKVEPLERAFKELAVTSWFSGLRREQAKSRAHLPVLQLQNNRFKLLPIINWSNKQVYQYLKEHGLSYHPLWEKGYVSVGDWHTSQPLQPGMTEEETRFFGLKRECGIHEEHNGSGI
ncbi:phosphoadenylyl-sulfate reductase [Celerinatantimonas yamalensis]|uniref:Phosphoadenosine 5'-phosphosulfate reductase n=1 Tax=Celerinatantimonas yamalensis TaxID=559956 RepID=A0ABW9GCL6_9GAMM